MLVGEETAGVLLLLACASASASASALLGRAVLCCAVLCCAVLFRSCFRRFKASWKVRHGVWQ